MTLAFVANVFPVPAGIEPSPTGSMLTDSPLAGLTKALASRGHRVLVFSHSQHARMADGVTYRSLDNFIDSPAYDALILFENAAKLIATAQAPRRVLWLPAARFSDFDEHLFPHLDHVLVSLPTHADFLARHWQRISPQRISVLRPGLDEGWAAGFSGRQPAKTEDWMLANCSSGPGLLSALTLLLRIRAEVPAAELILPTQRSQVETLLGGFTGFTRLLNQPGVRFVQPCNRTEWRDLLEGIKISLLPHQDGDWVEWTDQLTGLAAGVVPVLTETATARHVTGEHGLFAPGHPGLDLHDASFVRHAVALLSDSEMRDWFAQRARHWIQETCLWPHVAGDFEQALATVQSRRAERIEIISPQKDGKRPTQPPLSL